MRAALEKLGAPVDLLQCVENPSIPLSQELMSICDLTMATGGAAMVKAAYSSGKPAYGVGAGNSTMVIDETADIVEAAHNSMLSKMSDFGSGCSADGNLIVEASIYDDFLEQLQKEGGYLVSEEQKQKLAAGKKVFLDKMTGRNGQKFGASLQVDAANRSINFSGFKQEKKLTEEQNEKQTKTKGAKQKVG
jgi:sulfoacetaldehyde dehydrogenase